MNPHDKGETLTFNVLAIVQGFLVLFACAFLAASVAGEDSMLPDIYGQAVRYPAEMWATWFLIGHGAAAWGMWSSNYKTALAGLALVTPAYFLLAVFAQPAAFGSVITLHSMLVGAPIQILTGAVVAIFGVVDDDGE